MTVSRRALISMLPPAALVLTPLGGCAALSEYLTGTNISKVASDVDQIATGVTAVLPTIKALLGIKDDVVAKVTAIVDEIKAVATKISGSTSTGTVALVKELGSAVYSISETLGGVALPSWVKKVVEAATALLPTIEAAVGIVAPLGARRFASTMTPDQARAVLAAARSR